MPFYERIKGAISKYKVLIKNFSSLSILQASQYIFPLITFPYLVRVLGPDGFGLVAFATAFTGYFSVITDYGFNLSATKNVSINRDDPNELKRIYNSVISTKLILLIGSLFIFLPIVLGFSKFSDDLAIYLISFISVLGTALSPIWFFQGLERMGFITAISVVIKFVWVLSIFLFIQDPTDILTLVLLNSISSLLVGIVGIFVVSRYFNLEFKLSSYDDIFFQLKDSWYYFISNMSVSLYTISNIFILGLFSNNTVVGYFSAADKIRIAVQNLLSISGRTIFPYLSLAFVRSKRIAISFLRKYTLSFGIISLIYSLVLYFFSGPIIQIVLGSAYNNSISLLKILAFLPFIIFLSNVAGVQTMLNLGYKKEFSKIILISGIFNIIASLIIVPMYFSLGTATVVLITEMMVTIQMLIFLYKKNINLFSNENNIV